MELNMFKFAKLSINKQITKFFLQKKHFYLSITTFNI